MTIFSFSVNGREVAKAGIDGTGVLSLIVSLMRRARSRSTQEEIRVELGALQNRDGHSVENMNWLRRRLVVGDELTVRLSQSATCDNPLSAGRKMPQRN